LVCAKSTCGSGLDEANPRRAPEVSLTARKSYCLDGKRGGGAVGLDPLTAFLIPVVIALAFTLLARRFPARRSGESAPARAPAKTFRIGFGAAYFGLWLLTSGAAAWVLLRAAAWLGPHQQPED